MTYGLGNGTYGKEEDGGLPSAAGGIRQEGAKVSHTKKWKGCPLGGETGKPPLRISTAPFFPGGGAMAGCLFFSRADKIGEGFVPAG